MQNVALDYTVPPGVHPLMAGLLTVMHTRPVDMLDLIDGLPSDALLWRPGPQMSSLAGLVRHVMDVSVSAARDDRRPAVRGR